MAHNSRNVAEPSILLSSHYASSSLTITEQLYGHRAERRTTSLAKLSYESFEAKGST